MQYESPWTTGERVVSYSVPTIWGTNWIIYDTVGTGIHMLDVHYDDPWPSNYFEDWATSLRFVDPSGVAETILSTSLFVKTEPAPALYATFIESPSDSVKFAVAVESLPGGWGGAPACYGYPVVIEIVVVTPMGDPLFIDTVPCLFGQQMLAVLGFPYQGEVINVCLRVTLLRIDQTMIPTAFAAYTVAQSPIDCQTVGVISTNVSSQLMVATNLIMPNPCIETAEINVTSEWEIRTITGQLVQHGNGPETINTGTWSSGIYLVRSGRQFQKLLRK